MKTIFIYKDEGVGGLSVKALIRSLNKSEVTSKYLVSTISADELIYGPWENECEILVIPGGRDVPYHQALQGMGNQKIKRFIEKGGKYLGICAGAYYASNQVIFEKESEHEVIEKRELSFFPGNAIGVLYKEKPFTYEGHKSAHLALVQSEKESLYTYYNGGCYFENAEAYSSSVDILARYQNAIYHNVPAVVMCRVGKGKALLSGVHFEVCPQYCGQEKKMRERLKLDESKRQHFFDDLLSRLIG